MISTLQFLPLLLKINSEHAFKAQFVTFSMISASAPKHTPRHPPFCIKKPLEGWQNSRVPPRFSLFGHVSDFATPLMLFKVFRSRFWPLRAPTLHNSMISSRNVTFFALKDRSDLNMMCKVRKGHAKDCLNPKHLYTFACEKREIATIVKCSFSLSYFKDFGVHFRRNRCRFDLDLSK